MSHSRLAIYDRTKLISEGGLFAHNPSERSITVYDDTNNIYSSEEPWISWDPDSPPFPTPLIYLKQKRS